LAPIIDQFGVESKGKVRVGKINVEASPVLASKYNIMSVPFYFIFDNGQMRESGPGGLQKQDIMMKMAPYI
jgi:thioredoxin-like negative regulator of GroEL